MSPGNCSRLVAARLAAYALLQEGVPDRRIDTDATLQRGRYRIVVEFQMENPMETHATADDRVSRYVGPIRKGNGPEPGERGRPRALESHAPPATDQAPGLVTEASVSDVAQSPLRANGLPSPKANSAKRSPMRRCVAASGWSWSGNGSSAKSASP
ncbi:hypothetical protein NOGI109294_05765 [Nocardiopsis gilva]